MKQEFYDYSCDRMGRYRFVSRGKKDIVKIVDFSPTQREFIFNLWFGDLLPDETVDDMNISNNGDIIKVLATIIQIIKEFTAGSPQLTIVFKGNTTARMSLYSRILKKYHAEFAKEFIISAFVFLENKYREVPFDPGLNIEYWAFFVKRNM